MILLVQGIPKRGNRVTISAADCFRRLSWGMERLNGLPRPQSQYFNRVPRLKPRYSWLLEKRYKLIQHNKKNLGTLTCLQGLILPILKKMIPQFINTLENVPLNKLILGTEAVGESFDFSRHQLSGRLLTVSHRELSCSGPVSTLIKDLKT